MTNRSKLKQLILDVFLLSEEEYSLNLKREDIQTWDSLGVVSMAVGIQETFGYHLRPEQATAIASVSDIIQVLTENGVHFDV
jgi:acyl carrier protein